MAGDVQATIRALVEEGADDGQLRAELDGLLEDHPDARWEVLDILDAYYRSGRLNESLHGFREELEHQIYGEDQDRTQIMPRREPSRSSRALAEAKLNERMVGRRWDRDGDTSEPEPVDKHKPEPANAGAAEPGQPRKKRKRGKRARKLAALRAVPSEKARPAKSQQAPYEEPDEKVVTVRGLRRLRPGTVLKDRFVLMSPLGRGGMGVVFKALDRQREGAHTRTPCVALKVLREEFKDNPDWLAVLQRETQNAQSLAHPNVVNVFDFDRDGDICFMTMELLEGESLATIFAKTQPKTFPEHECMTLIEGMAQGLAYAHSKDIAHCDFKPGNVFVTADGAVKILDFGIARLLRTPDVAEAIRDSSQPVTPAYASCEALEGGPPDARDDVYSLGVVSYELLSGRHPFDRKSAVQARHLRMEPEPIAGMNRRQWRALRRTLELNREDRTGSVLDFLAEFRPAGRSPGFDRRVDRSARLVNRGRGSRKWIGPGLLLAATIGAAAFLVFSLTPGIGPDDFWLDDFMKDDSPPKASAPAETGPAETAAVTSGARSDAGPDAGSDAGAVTSPEAAPEIASVDLGRDRPRAGTAPTENIPVPAVTAATETTTDSSTESSTGPAGTSAAPTSARTTTFGPAPVDTASEPATVVAGATVDAGETPVAEYFDGFRLNRTTLAVSEAALFASINVRRATATGEAAFIWHTEDGTAVSGEDYAGSDYVTEWLADGEISRDVLIPIASDTLVEGDRTFMVVIEPMSAEGTLGTPARTTVIIRDDD